VIGEDEEGARCGTTNTEVSFHDKYGTMMRLRGNFQKEWPVAMLMLVMTYGKLHGTFSLSRWKLKILQLYEIFDMSTWTLGDFTNAQQTIER